jgi:hypothetical protein
MSLQQNPSPRAGEVSQFCFLKISFKERLFLIRSLQNSPRQAFYLAVVLLKFPNEGPNVIKTAEFC